MTNYLLRSIDPALWARVKARADADGLTLRDAILALLQAYAKGSVVVSGSVTAKARR